MKLLKNDLSKFWTFLILATIGNCIIYSANEKYRLPMIDMVIGAVLLIVFLATIALVLKTFHMLHIKKCLPSDKKTVASTCLFQKIALWFNIIFCVKLLFSDDFSILKNLVSAIF
jgi:FtsH-binding integral membrane protein